MSMFKNITIKYFRGFDKIEIENLSKINLFLGKNNSGKSTILEAIFLLTGMSNPSLPIAMNRIRSSDSRFIASYKYLFYNANYTQHPTFESCMTNNKKRSLELSPLSRVVSDQENEILELNSFSSDAGSEITGIKLSFGQGTEFKDKPYSSTMSKLSDGTTKKNIDQYYKEEILAMFIATGKNDDSSVTQYSEIVKKQKKEIIIACLTLFDDKIETIEVLPDGLYLGIKGMAELLPISMAGDGIRQFLAILISIVNPSNKIVLIDEIDNGLHYSSFKLLWKNIFKIVSDTDIQLFITTHNNETLNCLKEILDDSSVSKQNLLRVYSIEKTLNKGFQAYSYSYDGLKGAIERNIELRS